MKFLIDRCAGRRLAEAIRSWGHDVVEVRALGPDPGDRALLGLAAADRRILVTLDTDFGQLVFLGGQEHSGLVRMPDVPAARRIELMETLLNRHEDALAAGAIVTIREDRIRISWPPSR